jgi:hypothetical protein
MSRVIIPAPHCQRCSDSDMRLRRIERHTKDQVTYCWRCERCHHMSYVIVEMVARAPSVRIGQN